MTQCMHVGLSKVEDESCGLSMLLQTTDRKLSQSATNLTQRVLHWCRLVNNM